MNSAHLIQRIGAALYGSRFDTDLAEALGVNRRTVRRWRNGEDVPRAGVWRDLDILIMERLGELRRLQRDLSQWAERPLQERDEK